MIENLTGRAKTDSLVEEAGFELSVPPRAYSAVVPQCGDGGEQLSRDGGQSRLRPGRSDGELQQHFAVDVVALDTDGSKFGAGSTLAM